MKLRDTHTYVHPHLSSVPSMLFAVFQTFKHALCPCFKDSGGSNIDSSVSDILQAAQGRQAYIDKQLLENTKKLQQLDSKRGGRPGPLPKPQKQKVCARTRV